MTNCDCSNNGIKAYFKLDYKPNKLSQLANDTHYVDINDVLDEINTHNTSETAHTYIQGRIDATNTTIGDLTELDTSVKTSVVDAINSEVSARGNADTALENDYNAKIGTLSDLDSSVKTSIVGAINSVISDETTIVGNLDDLDTSVKTSIVTAINSEVSDRQSADSGLQTQIDALAASSDVTDIVGTYAELQAYDTQHLNDNDIIKVLDDSTHNDAPSYYRYNKSTDSFTYIGSESASYTKAESDTLFVPQTRTVNSKALSADITLTSSDVGALASTTTINDLTTTAQQNALNSGATTTNIGQIATNTSSISTINGKIPSDASSSNKLVTASALSNAVVNLADKDFSNLTETGEERLHALKSYSDNGEILTDAEGMADVYGYAHSTFDRSKFTVVGSPVITDDGILSTTSSSKYIKTPSILLGNNWDIIIPLKGVTVRNSPAETLLRSDPAYEKCAIGIAWSRMAVFFRDINNNQISVDYPKVSGNTFVQIANVTYLMKLSCRFDGTNYTITAYASNDDGATWASGTPTVTASIPYVAQNSESWLIQPYRMTADSVVDLKQFSITVDGVEVFSGNKTGIDTIKPDNYTVVGTPTISTDGIASGFSSSNYITTSKYAPKAPFIDEIEFITGSDVSTAQTIYGQDGNYRFRITGGNFSGSYNLVTTANISVSANTHYKAVMVFDGTQMRCGLKQVGSDYTYTAYKTATALTSNTPIYIGANWGATEPFLGSIDLNGIKSTVNGNLVYQPCLKIPYTQSKTGSKIVNAIYRDRVNDMAEQFGYANYYTLDEDNGNFTLPQVELYGLIGDKTLRDSYYNGVTYWELFSNRRLEQGGSCESGVEYTLPKPFADANYVLTIPYSSKTATSFIPSATGDFIAKGIGLL